MIKTKQPINLVPVKSTNKASGGNKDAKTKQQHINKRQKATTTIL